MADPVTYLIGGLTIAAYNAYLRQGPTTQNIDVDHTTAETPAEKYVTLKNKRLFVNTGPPTVFQGMETNGDRMLEGQMPIDQLPEDPVNSPAFMRWWAKNDPLHNKKSRSIKDFESTYEETMKRAYEQWKRKYAGNVGATIDTNLLGVMAENVRSQNEMMSGRAGHLYTLENELKPILYRKNTNRGRFSPYGNTIDDNSNMVAQRGMAFAFPPVTRMGVSRHYNLKANSDSGGYYDPVRAAPARAAKVGNTYSPVDAVMSKAPRARAAQYRGKMM